ncbi:hypothetical protein [Arthrobacter sp. NPDC090010]|uniref:hypothetical protein n=1 Tax=Arthrobacter sp. NPDC090010 TaxID=3363942 RepID=UPI00380E1E40
MNTQQPHEGQAPENPAGSGQQGPVPTDSPTEPLQGYQQAAGGYAAGAAQAPPSASGPTPAAPPGAVPAGPYASPSPQERGFQAQATPYRQGTPVRSGGWSGIPSVGKGFIIAGAAVVLVLAGGAGGFVLGRATGGGHAHQGQYRQGPGQFQGPGQNRGNGGQNGGYGQQNGSNTQPGSLSGLLVPSEGTRGVQLLVP